MVFHKGLRYFVGAGRGGEGESDDIPIHKNGPVHNIYICFYNIFFDPTHEILVF